jgi:hypothetical protein
MLNPTHKIPDTLVPAPAFMVFIHFTPFMIFLTLLL